MNEFERTLQQHGLPPLAADGIAILQINVGFLCNLSCRHCHVEASRERPEVMQWPTMKEVLRALDKLPGCRADITGGAPEMNPNFRRLVRELRARELPVQVRTNLAVFFEPGMEDLPEFYRELGVDLVASMPCYLEQNVTAQRGTGVYQRAVTAICRLNELGYGTAAAPALDLVYNPGGPFLPPDQEALQEDYRRELDERFGLRFNRLLTLTNLPIGRFMQDLEVRGKAVAYRSLLETSFNPRTVPDLMCRRQVCVAWDGSLYDCDFNLALGLGLAQGAAQHIEAFDPATLARRPVCTGNHCFGCTAGAGSSCGGALADDLEPQCATGS